MSLRHLKFNLVFRSITGPYLYSHYVGIRTIKGNGGEHSLFPLSHNLVEISR